jgi:DeoR/GlpR family transcriptional regulator of sugar metabolism
MILSELRSYLTERRRASLADLANRFDTDAEVLRGMLATLERKGRVRKLAVRACGGGCSKCEPTSLELYETIESCDEAKASSCGVAPCHER